jgi:60 kDa SS-A/Ro ribonucleoprotein
LWRPRQTRLAGLPGSPPNKTTQAGERADILNVGGFSDAVFDVIADFAEGRPSNDHWAGKIEEVKL